MGLSCEPNKDDIRVCLLNLGVICDSLNGEYRHCVAATICAPIGSEQKMCVSKVNNCVEYDAVTR